MVEVLSNKPQQLLLALDPDAVQLILHAMRSTIVTTPVGGSLLYYSQQSTCDALCANSSKQNIQTWLLYPTRIVAEIAFTFRPSPNFLENLYVYFR